MTDEDKKRIVSEPPPPTDEIDGEWEDDETLVRDAPSLSDPPKVSVRPAGAPSVSTSTPPVKASSTPPAAASVPPAKAPAAAPAATSSSLAPTAAAATTPLPSVPPAEATGDEDEDEDDDDVQDPATSDDEDDEDEDEDEDEDDDDASSHVTPAVAPRSDWIPEWGPFAVLGLLVCVSIVVGLGLLGGRSEISEESEGKAEPAPAAKPAVKKPSAHP